MAFNKIQYPTMIKLLKKLKIEGTHLNLIKAICGKFIVNIILNGGKVLTFSLKFGMSQGSSLSQSLFNIVLETLTKAVRQEKEIKGTQQGRKKSTYSHL